MSLISSVQQSSNIVIEQQLDEKIRAIEAAFDADALMLAYPITHGVEEEIKHSLEDKNPKREKLLLILETGGGFIEVAERIVIILRHHYSEVEFLVPNYAFSAGTVLVLSGDAIHMDYSSVLGPIDPQVQRQGSNELVPALGYLEQYERFLEKARKQQLTTVEMAYFVERFDQAELYRYEQERELSIKLLRDWLVQYKFKNWKKTKSRKKNVTKRMKSTRAAAVARSLNNVSRWGSHSRGISIEVLRKDLKLEIEDFGQTPDRRDAVGDYYRLLKDYMMRRGQQAIIHTNGVYSGIGWS